ncbi:MAG: trypsin-like peptidase domain-containing protein [Rikenellaceae bacterium]
MKIRLKYIFAVVAAAVFSLHCVLSATHVDLTYAAESAVRAVVGIDAVQRVEVLDSDEKSSSASSKRSYQQRFREQMGGGSGVIISEDGYIVTNHHVIDGALGLRVKLYDGGTYDAEVVGVDPTTDIALIKIEQNGLPAIQFGSSDELRLGEWVIAIGSPFELQSTITAGIVSAKARQLDVIPNDFRIESFIQTDAALNTGNSGGALVNAKGELVGVNTFIKSKTGTYIGYSFAVPESIVRKVVTDLKEYGVVQRALLGVSFALITDEFVEERGKKLLIEESGGAYVAEVAKNGAAAHAGVKKGDIITSINGVQITQKTNLQEILAKYRPGDQIKIITKRGSTMKHFDIILRNHSGKAELQKLKNK